MLIRVTNIKDFPKPSLLHIGLDTPTWDLILDHIGCSVPFQTLESRFSKRNNVSKGSEYLKLWIASLLQHPEVRLPYLFLYSRDNETGKSTFGKALELLMSGEKGELHDVYLWNSALDGAGLCITNDAWRLLDKEIYSWFCETLISNELCINRLGEWPHNVPNTTHWVVEGKVLDECPDYLAVRFVTPIQVHNIRDIIPRDELLAKLTLEAPAFLNKIFNIEVK